MPVNRHPLEIRNLLEWLGHPPRAKRQTNRLHESDAEILKLAPGRWLALNVDGVSEEIAAGLYRDPYTMGWVTAQTTLSDLAACGASPLGFLSSALFPETFGLEERRAFQRGLNDALRKSKTGLLGGDHGSASHGVFHGFAIGETRRKPLSRVGIRPGDWICAAGRLGDGPALGFRFLLERPVEEFPESAYRPVAHLKEGAKLISFARAAIDSSDGFASAIHTLSLLNDLRFSIEPDRIAYSKRALEFCARAELPRETLLYGEHGDYQLIFAVAPRDLARAKRQIPDMRAIGRARPKRERAHLLEINGAAREWDPGFVAEADKRDLKKIREVFMDVLAWSRGLK